MKKETVLETCYDLFRNNTPLAYDCGKICNGKCCKGDEKTGMLLFPGEEKLIDRKMKILVGESGDKFAVCNGSCDRHERPLACRMYPLFPVIRNDGGKEYIDVVFDSRADCPIVSGEIKIEKRFRKAVKRVGKYLLLNEDTAVFYKKLSSEIEEYEKLKKFFEKD